MLFHHHFLPKKAHFCKYVLFIRARKDIRIVSKNLVCPPTHGDDPGFFYSHFKTTVFMQIVMPKIGKYLSRGAFEAGDGFFVDHVLVDWQTI